MSELGTRLRQGREALGLSLEQVAVDTRILQHALIALEDGAYERLPSDVVTRGFIRNYANYLNLSPEELIEIYRRERGNTDRIRIVPATNPPPMRNYGLPSFFGVFFVTLILAGLAYVGLNTLNALNTREQPASASAATSLVPSPSPLATLPPATAQAIAQPLAPSPTLAANEAAGFVPTTAASAGPTTDLVVLTPSPGSNAPIIVEVRIATTRGSESSWIRVQTDGNTAYEGIMRAGERQTFQAQRRILIRAGNPPDVLVTVNGLEQGALGQVPGQPVNWPWPPN
jgi:transcriptional regulator with XRE-family HTH domain